MGGVGESGIRKSHWGKPRRKFPVPTSPKQATGSHLAIAGEFMSYAYIPVSGNYK